MKLVKMDSIIKMKSRLLFMIIRMDDFKIKKFYARELIVNT